MNSKSGEEQIKVITFVEVLISTQIRIHRIQSKKKGQNDNALILGRISINTRTQPSPSNALILGRVLGLGTSLFRITNISAFALIFILTKI